MGPTEAADGKVRPCTGAGFSEGPTTAKLIIVGEAWGREEAWHKRPFVGASGQLLNKWLWKLGLRRHEVYVTNVVCDHPPGNDLKKLDKAVLVEWERQLHERLGQLESPALIVPLGNTALNALLRVRGASISNLRGSVLKYADAQGRELSMLPLLHPAAVLRSPDLQARTDIDLLKVKALLDGTSRAAEPITVTCATPDDALFKLEGLAMRYAPSLLAVDIETIPDSGLITSIAFASGTDSALAFPLKEWSKADTLKVMREAYREVLRYSDLILQNGFYDLTWLKAKFDIDLLDNYQWDTRWMHHALRPRDEHSLAHLASIYTNRPYWKDMRKAKGPFALYEYNGIDAAVTFEIWQALRKELTWYGRMDFYHEHYRKLYKPLFEIMRHGIRVNEAKRAQLVTDLTAKAQVASEAITAIVGEPLIAKKSVSTAKLAKYLYETAKPKLPKRMKQGKVTTEEAALLDLRTKFPDKNPDASKVIDLVLEHRGASKLVSTFLKDTITDKRGRAPCEYTFTPYTGRLSSGENPLGEGLNIQNVDSDVREIFLPDEGCVMLEVDLSQAEWRVVAMLTKDPQMIAMARTKPTEFDVHRYNAATIFGVSEADVTHEQRQTGKIACHAIDYLVEEFTLAQTFLKAGLVKTQKQCKDLIDLYLDKMLPIRTWQQTTMHTIRVHRALANTWGRIVHFDDERLSDAVYRAGLAWGPQGEVGDLLNHYGLKPAWLRYRKDKQVKINMQVHDALYVSAPPERVYEVAHYLTQCLERPRTYYSQDLVIPCTYKLHWNWKEGFEYKALPNEREFTAAAVEAMTKCLPN